MTEERIPRLGGQTGTHIHAGPGPLTGKEPMLKDRVRDKVSINRIGAYYAGNLPALVRMMSVGQKQAFKRWHVRLTLRRAKREQPYFRAQHPFELRPRFLIRAAEAWLANPCEETRRAAETTRRFHLAAYQYENDPFSYPAVFLAEWSALLAANPPGLPDPDSLVKRAQLRAAYIILWRGIQQ